ncbi:MAG: hypothetical protein AABX16_04730 [Nanoarchaeota archaeon]
MQTQLSISGSYTENKFERGNHIIGLSIWEFEWCTKYRYKALRK